MRHIGRFTVDDHFFEDLKPGEGTNLFRDMIPLDVRQDWARQTREYVAIHPSFRAIALGERIPEYNAVFHYHQGATSLPEWLEIPPVKAFTHEEVTAALDARLRRDNGLGDRPASNRASATNTLVGGGELRKRIQRLVDIQRIHWWDRLLQRGLALVRAVLGHGHAATGDDVPQGQQQLRAGPVGPLDGGQQHDPYGDGVLGEGAVGYESAAPAVAAQAPCERSGSATGCRCYPSGSGAIAGAGLDQQKRKGRRSSQG